MLCIQNVEYTKQHTALDIINDKKHKYRRIHKQNTEHYIPHTKQVAQITPL